ncbi:MAG TPA: inositol monophosphatase family protein [Pyrinomonadaceae bacterium]|nr:inositol monophosphatase family protein [Pyrinomonadaceae bacterium]
MGVKPTELKQLLDFAVRLANKAGEIAQQYFNTACHVERKSDYSLVTVADREIEDYLRNVIQAAFPDDSILGEEGSDKVGHSNRRWIIDPIDGTFSFVHRVPLFAVMIGLEIADEAVLGVVKLPALDEIIYAAKGLGCFFNGEPTRVSLTNSLRDALLLSTDFRACARHGFAEAGASLQSQAEECRGWGDAYGHVLVATGRADVMLDPVMNVWDCAALLPILEEAGGRFTDWQGQRTIHGGNAISTNALLFDEVMNTIRNADNPGN